MSLEKDFQYYLDHQVELAEQYEGKILVIKGEQVIGVYDDEDVAIKTTSEEYELGTFLVQECSADPDSTTVTYHSRAYFA